MIFIMISRFYEVFYHFITILSPFYNPNTEPQGNTNRYNRAPPKRQALLPNHVSGNNAHHIIGRMFR